MPKLRTLRFQSYEEIVAEAEHLLASGYTRGGNWSLGQICEHLAKFMEMSVSGFPFTVPAFLQKLVRWTLWKTVADHKPVKMKAPAPAALAPAAEVADAAGLERLRAAVAVMKNPPGPLKPSPMFGPLTNDEWLTLHLWHCEHHLGFLAPTTPGGSKQGADNGAAAKNA